MSDLVAIEDLAAWRECRDCGLFQRLPEIPDGEAAICSRCSGVLQRAARDSIAFARTAAVVAAALFALALCLPLVTFSVLGRVDESTLFSGPAELEDLGQALLAVVVFVTLILAPAAKLAVQIVVLFGLHVKKPPGWLPRLFGTLETIGPWAMVDVFLLGSFVAYTRLRALAHVDVGLAAAALGGVMLAMVATDALLDREAIWQELEAKTAHRPARKPRRRARYDANRRLLGCEECGRVNHAREGDPCVRCHEHLEHRKGNMGRVWALVIAAALLYIPANVLPVMTIKRLGQGGPHTIFNGVVELIHDRLYPLAILVLLASVVVPMFKLVSLVAMMIMTQRRSRAFLAGRTRLFRFIKFIGRWSMLDIFMLSVLVGVVRFGSIASVTPGLGATAFCGVVLVTMVATELFDSRLMWDAAGLEEEAYEGRQHALGTG